MPGAATDQKQTRTVARVGGRNVVVTAALSLGLLALALRQADLGLLARSLAQVNYTVIAGAVAMYFVDLGFRSVRWRVLLSGAHEISARRLYPVLAIGYMANNLLPARIGELSRAYLVGRREQISPGTVLASVAIERVIDGLTVLVLLLVALPSLPVAPWLGALMRLAAMTFGAAVVLCLVLSTARPLWNAVTSHLLLWLPTPLAERVAQLLDRFIEGFVILRDARRLGETLVLSVVIWLVGAITYLLVAAAFGVALSPLGALAAICVVNLATAVPLAPGGLGAFELAAVAIFSVLGITGTLAAGITVVLHAVLFLPVVVVGLIFLWHLDLSLEGLWLDAHPPGVEPAVERGR